MDILFVYPAESEGFENYERYVHATHKRQRRLWNVA